MQDLVSPDELAERWKISPGTLGYWRWMGFGPQFIKMGRRVFYRPQDIEGFEEKRLRRHTSRTVWRN